MELFPIRCFTCNKPLAGLQRQYEELVSSGVPIAEAMDRLGIVRTCCRTRAMNPGIYVFPGGEEYPQSAIARKTTAKSEVIEPKNTLASIKGQTAPTIQQLPITSAKVQLPKVPTPTPLTLTSILPSTETPVPSSILKPLRPLEPLTGLESSMQELKVSEKPKIKVAPLNLETVQLKPLGDIKLPRVYFL